MNYTLEDVKNFILEFTELEYQFRLGQFDNSITDEEWYVLVAKLENCYSEEFGYYAIITAYRDESLMTKELYNNNKKNLKKRRLFLIRKYENPKFGKGIYNADSGLVFSALLGAESNNIRSEIYQSNLSVGIVNGELKIITERDLNSEKRRKEEVIEWIYNKRSNVYTEGITIKKDGTLIETLRIVEPEHPTWIADYNQG
ncbi:hypothetical protein [Chryseobacterium scophthalmum]|uniref:Uncharacterized protein n=1 Tax=Chryseobacterium scophthalmum TaxID=59733 RepID=A0A1N6EGJ6_9FLAO|nr:hypothetical protein [Chryseobacterium scophthalmum]SIN82126.1 hypothetical protein SAMN05421769_0330 [Chryseobacterium scophthalmum]